MAEEFLQFTVAKSGENGRASSLPPRTTLIRTPGGWREAGEIMAGDRVMVAEPKRLSATQWQVILGGLMGDAALVPPTRAAAVAPDSGWVTAAKQAEYLEWKASMFGNIEQSRSANAKGAVFRRPDTAARVGRAA